MQVVRTRTARPTVRRRVGRLLSTAAPRHGPLFHLQSKFPILRRGGFTHAFPLRAAFPKGVKTNFLETDGQTMTIDQRHLAEALKGRDGRARKSAESLAHPLRFRLRDVLARLCTVESVAALVAVLAFGIGLLFATFVATVAAEKLLDFIHGEKKIQNSSFTPLRHGGENATMCAKSRTVHSRAFLCPAPSRGLPRAPISGGVFYPWCGTFFDFNAEASESATAS